MINLVIEELDCCGVVIKTNLELVLYSKKNSPANQSLYTKIVNFFFNFIPSICETEKVRVG